MTNVPLRVMVVDDSTLFRKVVRDAFCDIPDVEVVGIAHNGKTALGKLDQLRPDLMTLDIEMPEMDGLEVLQELKQKGSKCGAIMLSSLTSSGARLTTRALSLGAFDFLLKPVGNDVNESLMQLRSALTPKVEAFRRSRMCQSGACVNEEPVRTTPVPPALKAMHVHRPKQAPKIVVIGVSTGGPASLVKLLPQFPQDFPVPIVIVQHMPPVFTKNLAEDLNRIAAVDVAEAQAGEILRPGTVRIAPGGRQLKLVESGFDVLFDVNDEPPERMCKPSVDYLFRSASEVFGPATLAVVMTGMGDDGCEGARLLRAKQATVIAQDAASCVVYGMPRQVIDAGLASMTCSLDELAPAIIQQVDQRVPLCR